MVSAQEWIKNGKAVLGIELGSTRIKATLLGDDQSSIASGSYEWENKLVDGIWTYDLEDIWTGLRGCYQNLTADVKEKYGLSVTNLAAIGISGMMHGYMPFDKTGELLVPFRTWRNTITEKAASALTNLFDYHIPQRWSIAHLYQAVINKEEHVENIAYFTTLAGYIHWKLTGKKVLGVGEASGMFPIDPKTKDYYDGMIQQFQSIPDIEKYPWKLRDILPKVLVAGENAGFLTEEGAKLLDISGKLSAQIPMCPPEGDAGTGMVATNSVKVRTGNVSVGTSVFAMVVLEEELKEVHEELDLVTTPAGDLVAMAHCNNGTSDLNSWVNLFEEFAMTMGLNVDKNQIFSTLYHKALEASKDCGGLMACNYLSGEHVTGCYEGRPLFIRRPSASFTLANFIRSHLYASLATLKIGCNILFQEEQVKVDKICGHGGFFKTPLVGQKLLAAAMNAPVEVMETAGEGGSWGIALLASYMVNQCGEINLKQYLDEEVFGREKSVAVEPDIKDVKGFEDYLSVYRRILDVEKLAIKAMEE